MNKQEQLEMIKQAAFEDEIEKIALSNKTLASTARKASIQTIRAMKGLKKSDAAEGLNVARNIINRNKNTKSIREVAKNFLDKRFMANKGFY